MIHGKGDFVSDRRLSASIGGQGGGDPSGGIRLQGQTFLLTEQQDFPRAYWGNPQFSGRSIQRTCSFAGNLSRFEQAPHPDVSIEQKLLWHLPQCAPFVRVSGWR